MGAVVGLCREADSPRKRQIEFGVKYSVLFLSLRIMDYCLNNLVEFEPHVNIEVHGQTLDNNFVLELASNHIY